MTTHQSRLCQERHLVPPGSKHRPAIGIATEQPVSGLAHEHEILEIGTDTTEDTEDHLDEERGLDEPAVDKMRQIVKMANIVAFVLEPRACVTQRLENVGDVAEGVAENIVVGVDDIGLLPVMLPLFDPLRGGEEGEVDRTHVK